MFVGRAEQHPNTRIECIGNTLDILDRDIALASFNGTDVRAMKLATFAKFFLAQAERKPLCSNDIAQISLKKRRVHVVSAPCPTGIKLSTAFR